MARPADRWPEGAREGAEGFRAEDQRRRDPRDDRIEPAEADAAARIGPDDLLAARQLHGPPHRRFRNLVDLGRDLQRALPPRLAALPRPFHPGRDAASVA